MTKSTLLKCVTRREFYTCYDIPESNYRMFCSILPLQGFMVAIAIFTLFILASWL